MIVTRPRVAAVILKEGKFLIIKRKDDVRWMLPNWKIGLDTEVYTMMANEIFKQTGLEVSVENSIGKWNSKDNEGNEVVFTNFLCKFVGGDFKINTEGVDFKWVTPTEFMMNQYKVPHDSLKKAISNYFKV